MIGCDALIVGGGPGGSTCARTLRRAGWNVIVLDRATFPRDKVCAGWVTPDAFRLLDLDPAEYRATGLTFQEIRGFRTGVLGSRLVHTRYPGIVSYAIRRCEFDDYLLRRASADVRTGTSMQTLRKHGDTWIVNEAFQAPVVIGAGGHFCPVARHLRSGAGTMAPVVAKEAECHLDGRTTSLAPDTPELFFCRDLEGYAWCVRKGDYVNVGIGRRTNDGFGRHVTAFAAFLEETGRLARATDLRWKGHAYLANGVGPRAVTADGLLLIGDAAGLAYSESGEGIKPAIESGRLAAETLITARRPFGADVLSPYADTLRRLYPLAPRTPAALRPLVNAAGRALLTSPVFTRRIVLDRWFLRQ